MTAQRIDGKQLAAQLRADIKSEITTHLKKGVRAPGLAVILIGHDLASQLYVKNKRLACEEVGIHSFVFNLSADITEKELLDLIHDLNQRADIDGILVQLPLPSHITTQAVIETIDPQKDVDGFHPYNLGRLAQFQPTLRPCTPYGIMMLLGTLDLTLKGKRAVVVGASNIVGKPMALELLMAKCTVTLCHSATLNLQEEIEKADILVAALGHPHVIRSEWIKPGAVVIDVGMNRIDGVLKGDIAYETAAQRAAWITPVPGGVGPMTVAMLLKNTLSAWRRG
ncbi:MAG: bifunctional methylenetetrahydrofolate dehydrogenase/methenyltetrahydrofolate cyclohydrolase FolD [Gammaproteobacteria bacterium]|nr:bifunctional methylenetetrahydrofolate dehydrogenase/methenyltetrahydrofolate cyclohydrolase FolD [Gammaproteobacteria bacterium]